MSILVALFGIAIFALGAFGVIRPTGLTRFVASAWANPGGLPAVVGLRLVFGVLLLLVAGSSRFPTALQILGAIAIASAALVLLLGTERLQKFVDWWVDRPDGIIRARALAAEIFGAFLVYAVL
jgi:hypothetical protein